MADDDAKQDPAPGPASGPAPGKDKLPGNHGQFGTSDATEDYKKLEDQPDPDAAPSQGPKQTNAGERS